MSVAPGPHASHRVDGWQQYGLVAAQSGLSGGGAAGAGLAVDVVAQCRRCERAVEVGGRVTPAGEQPCVGAPGRLVSP